MPSKKPSGSTKFPPSLARTESEFKKLCDELGGPADIGVTVDPQYMELCCQEHPADSLLPILLRFQEDQTVARRHWPWVAFAISQYAFERSELAKYTDEPTPKEVIDMLKHINKTAHDLGSGLARLQALSYRLAQPAATGRRAHLAWLNAFISQAIGGRISNEVKEHALQMLADDFKTIRLLKQLADLEVVTNAAMHRVDKSLLERERGQSDQALPRFIFRCSRVWTSLTGRKPSAEKVHRRIQPSEPDFLIFARELAKCAGVAPPSRKQVHTNLRKFRTPN